MTKRVAVALSGGVDSAVVALLLKEQGYDVVGLTGVMTDSNDSAQIVQKAKSVADKIGIHHYAYDVSKDFHNRIITYFEESYIRGLTPNPCIMCNKYIKWGKLFDYAINDLGADYIATGHYADIKKMDSYYKLYPALDEVKDQLYFLYKLNQDTLSKTLFPLAKYKKEEVRFLAEKYDLPPKSAKESQDICFIKLPMTTKKYLRDKFGESFCGNFVQKSTGKVLGQHDGFWQYTIGQRKGIGLAAPEPLYVVGISANTNTVYVGYKDELFINEFVLPHLDFSYPQEKTEFEADVKIRYNMKSVKSLITKTSSGWNIRFSEPISALSAGQACVLYDITDGHLLGGFEI